MWHKVDAHWINGCIHDGHDLAHFLAKVLKDLSHPHISSCTLYSLMVKKHSLFICLYHTKYESVFLKEKKKKNTEIHLPSSSLLACITSDQAVGYTGNTETRLTTGKAGMWTEISNRVISSWNRNRVIWGPHHNLIADTRKGFASERICCQPKEDDQKTKISN